MTNTSTQSTSTVSKTSTTVSTSTPSWISSLGDSVLKADMAAIASSGTATEAQMTKVFDDLVTELQNSKSSLSSSQFKDLQTIASNLGSLGASSYVQYITNALVDGNVANQTWTGGGGRSVTLGNLGAGSSATVLSELTAKWFQGSDNPADVFTLSGYGAYAINYSSASVPLYGATGAPVASDVNQGFLGDCYLLAPLAEAASQDPSIIENMITNNGNGTYGVRFYIDGQAHYVTVNATLPDGGYIFNSSNDAAWASIIEKAYAELPSLSAIEGSASYSNSFTTIGNGGDPAYALLAITGSSNITEIAADGSNWENYGLNASENWTGYLSYTSNATTASEIEADLAVGDDVILSSYTNATDARGNSTLIADHAMSVYGYDATTGMLEIRNPWGAEAGQNWDTTFEVSINTLLADGDVLSVDNAGTVTTVAGASVFEATGLQMLAKVTSFSVSDSVANVAANLTALESDTKLSALTVNGTTGADSLNLTGFRAATTVNLGSNSDTAKISGSGASEKLSIGSTYDYVALGSGTDIVDYTLGSGVLDVANFSAAHDTLSIALNGGSLTQTILGGSDWITSSNDLTHGVLLAGVSTKQTVTVSGGLATVA